MMNAKKNEQNLYCVFGGYLESLNDPVFNTSKNIDLVGIFFDYEAAHAAWKEKAQSTVDNAQVRYFLINLKDLLDV